MEQRVIYRTPWRIELTEREGSVRIVSAAELARTVDRALRAARAPEPAAMGVILTGDAEIAALNQSHMGQAGPTDVLSFPLLPPGAFPEHAGIDAADRSALRPPPYALPRGQRTHLGEIIISVERAIEHAERGRGGHGGDVRWSPADELRLLVTHGVLHLCGWDHAHPVEEAAMRTLERRLLGMGDPA